jgi:hypothetical protein
MGNSALRKKLFRVFAGGSVWLAVDNDILGHGNSLLAVT